MLSSDPSADMIRLVPGGGSEHAFSSSGVSTEAAGLHRLRDSGRWIAHGWGHATACSPSLARRRERAAAAAIGSRQSPVKRSPWRAPGGAVSSTRSVIPFTGDARQPLASTARSRAARHRSYNRSSRLVARAGSTFARCVAVDPSSSRSSERREAHRPTRSRSEHTLCRR